MEGMGAIIKAGHLKQNVCECNLDLNSFNAERVSCPHRKYKHSTNIPPKKHQKY